VDYSFFALGLIGALVGYIVGDVQRERRYRRDARANLARANARTNRRASAVRADALAHANARTDDDGDDDGGAFYLGEYRQAGRRAIPRDNNGPRPGAHAAGGDTGFEHEKTMTTATMVGLS
jgi:hypothetical protein